MLHDYDVADDDYNQDNEDNNDNYDHYDGSGIDRLGTTVTATRANVRATSTAK